MADRIVDVSKVSEFTMDGYPGQYLRNIVAKDDELGFGLHYVRIAEGHSLPEHTHDGIEVVYLLGNCRRDDGRRGNPGRRGHRPGCSQRCESLAR